MKKISLKAARVDAGLTQKEVIESLHISWAKLISWEKGKKTPDKETLSTLCQMYDVKRDDLRI